MKKLILSLAIAGSACQPATPADPPPPPVAEGSAAAAPAAPLLTQVAEQGQLRLTAEDVLIVAEWDALRAGQTLDALLGDDWRSEPPRLMSLTRAAAEVALLRADADRLELTVSEQEIDTAWEATSALVELGPRPLQLASYPLLNDERIRELLADQVRYRRWLEATLALVDDDALRRFHAEDAERLQVEIVSVPNLPTPQMIDIVLATDPDGIEERYQQSFRRRVPTAALVRRYIYQGHEDDAAELGLEHAQAGEPPAGAGWAVRDEWVNARVEPELNSLDELAFSALAASPEGPTFYQVLELRPTHIRPLDDTLRREVAAAIAQESRPSEACATSAEAIYDALTSDAPVDDLIAASRARRQMLPEFGRSDVGMVIGVGNQPELHDLLFAADEQVWLPPVFIGSDLVIARVVEHAVATDEAFERDRAEIRQRYERRLQLHAWSQRVDAYAESHELVVDLEALQEALQAYP